MHGSSAKSKWAVCGKMDERMMKEVAMG